MRVEGINSLSHTKRNYRYHIVFAPKLSGKDRTIEKQVLLSEHLAAYRKAVISLVAETERRASLISCLFRVPLRSRLSCCLSGKAEPCFC